MLFEKKMYSKKVKVKIVIDFYTLKKQFYITTFELLQNIAKLIIVVYFNRQYIVK